MMVKFLLCWKNVCALLLAVLLFQQAILAQQPRIKFNHFTIDEGLSQNTVWSMLQDRDGFIWIGTEDGLNRFDGYSFTYYHHDLHNANSISHNQVNALTEDADGNLWIGTADGLNIFNKRTEQFTRILTSQTGPVSSNEFITSIFIDKRKSIWITGHEGLKLFDAVNRKFILFKSEQGGRADRIMEDTRGMFWVSVDRDLRRFDPVAKRFLPLPSILENNKDLRNSYIRAIKQDKDGKIWIGTENKGVFVYDEILKTIKNFNNKDNQSIPINIVRDIFFNSDKEVWIGTRDGLSIYDKKTNKFSNYKNDRYDPNSISQNSIRTIMRDKAGNIWIGTYSGGVNLVTTAHSMFGHIGAATSNTAGINYKMAGAITGAPNGGLWIGTEGGGINYANANYTAFKSYALPQVSTNIGSNTIKCFLADGDNVWVGTFGGLRYLEPSSGALQSIEIPTENKEITSLVKTRGALWIGTNGSGMVKMGDDGKFTVFEYDPKSTNGISRNNIQKIVKDENENLWIATYKGLNYFDQKTFTQYQHDVKDSFSVSHSHISTLFIDSKKRLWVGTKGGGLNYFDIAKKKFYVIDKSLGLANDVIQSIEEDNSGNLWVGTNKGLSRIIIKKPLPFTANAVEVNNYFVEDGLQANQFFLNSSYKKQDGELLFGGINGITYFHPENIRKNNYLPPIVITEFLIRNKPVVDYGENSPLKEAINGAEKIVLTYDQAFISFRFAALNYVNPGKNQYAYKLEGLERDNEWHYVQDQRLATYTNLDPGTYYFKVKASNNDGVWNETPKTIKIIILPPWWATWWAYTLYALAAGGLLYLYYSYSLRTERLKNELVVEQVIREKETELYQRKLNFFTNISHEIKTPLTLILAPLEKLLNLHQGNNRVHHQLMVMKRNGDRLVRLISQLLDFRKFESGDMKLQAAEGNIVGFIKEVLAAFEAFSSHLNVKLQLDADKKSIAVYFDEDKLEKILYNLLSNALKFTKPGGLITVRVKEHKIDNNKYGNVSIEVEDNGIGIAAENIEKIFGQFKHFDKEGINLQGTGIGLAFTKALVELHKGNIAVTSTPETEEQKGNTCFTVTLPLGKDHLSDADIVARKNDGEDIQEYDINPEKPQAIEALAKRAEKVLAHMDENPVMLIVEDNNDVLEFLKEHFEEKFSVHTASDGEEGVAKAINIIPDIIISDVMMPKMSGTRLTDTLKLDNRTSHIPIILLTARTQIIHKIEGLETGADDYITKPFNLSLVEARVWNLVEQRQQLRERYSKEITLQPTHLAITSPDEEFLEKIMAYIETNLSEPSLNVEDLAKEVFMSRTTLYRKIKALTNQSIVEFIRTIKLKRAAQLLEANKYRISEIAYMTGFSEINYFRKCFKEQYNQTPTEYMQAHINK